VINNIIKDYLMMAFLVHLRVEALRDYIGGVLL
jgi:hypothetical protein